MKLISTPKTQPLVQANTVVVKTTPKQPKTLFKHKNQIKTILGPTKQRILFADPRDVSPELPGHAMSLKSSKKDKTMFLKVKSPKFKLAKKTKRARLFDQNSPSGTQNTPSQPARANLASILDNYMSLKDNYFFLSKLEENPKKPQKEHKASPTEVGEATKQATTDQKERNSETLKIANFLE